MEQAGVFFLPPSPVSRFSGGLLGLPRGDAWSPCRKREIKTALQTGINKPWASPGETGAEKAMRFSEKGMGKTAGTDRDRKH